MQSNETENELGSTSVVHLWDVDHPYYCNEANYYSNECHARYVRWQDFIAEQGDMDLDLNLLFRWDWKAPRKDGEFEQPVEWVGDENYRDCNLQFFFIEQRKGLFRCVEVNVCRADELAVRKWLQIRYEHLLKLWTPFVSA